MSSVYCAFILIQKKIAKQKWCDPIIKIPIYEKKYCDWLEYLQKLFGKFPVGYFSQDDDPGWDEPVVVDSDQTKKLTENNHRYSLWEKTDRTQNIQFKYWITCTSLVVSITLMYGFHIGESQPAQSS